MIIKVPEYCVGLKSQDALFDVTSGKPALLRGWCREWSAIGKWCSRYFLDLCGNILVPISSYKEQSYQLSRKKPRVLLKDYLSVVCDNKQHDVVNKDSYLAGWHFMRDAPFLLDDIKIPQTFSEDLLDKVNQDVINYDKYSIFIGHNDVETPLHTDSFFVSVWISQIVGTKTIRIVEPVDYENIYNGLDVLSKQEVDNLGRLGIDVYEATLGQGDIIYVPPGHWHQVRNVGFTVAVSANYLHRYDFLAFEQQLKSKLLVPYFQLLKMKNQLLSLSDSEVMFSAKSAAHSGYKENEEKFLDYLISTLERDKGLIKRMQ